MLYLTHGNKIIYPPCLWTLGGDGNIAALLKRHKACTFESMTSHGDRLVIHLVSLASDVQVVDHMTPQLHTVEVRVNSQVK